MSALSTILRAAAGGEVATVIVVSPERGIPTDLLQAAREVGAEFSAAADPLSAFSEAALAERRKASRGSWGIASGGRTLIVGVEPIDEDSWAELEQASQAYLPDVALVRWNPGHGREAGGVGQPEVVDSEPSVVRGQPSAISRERIVEEKAFSEASGQPGRRTVDEVVPSPPVSEDAVDVCRSHPGEGMPVPAPVTQQGLDHPSTTLRLVCDTAPPHTPAQHGDDEDDHLPTLTREELAMLLDWPDTGGAASSVAGLPSGSIRSGGVT